VHGRALVTSQEASAPVTALVAAVDDVLAQVPAELPGPQALADTAELLRQVERLRAGLLGRIADVDRRQLHVIDGAPSTSSWVDTQQTSLDRGEVALARRMSTLPRVEEAVRHGLLSIAVAEQVGRALTKLRRHVDRPDGLIDGQDAEQALLGVIGHGVRRMVCEALGGLADDDPRLTALLADLAAIVQSSATQLARLEAAFVLLARRVEPAQLPGALGMLVDALLPNELEKKAADAHDDRGFGLRPNAAGDGWHITDGDLDLECGELLQTVLAAEQAVDPDNPQDTAEFQRLRQQGWRSTDELPGSGQAGPRSLRQQRHDALKRALRRYLDSGIAGLRSKAAPHVDVVVSVDLLDRAARRAAGSLGHHRRAPAREPGAALAGRQQRRPLRAQPGRQGDRDQPPRAHAPVPRTPRQEDRDRRLVPGRRLPQRTRQADDPAPRRTLAQQRNHQPGRHRRRLRQHPPRHPQRPQDDPAQGRPMALARRLGRRTVRCVTWCAVPCRAVPCRAVPCRAVACRAVPCRAMPCRDVASLRRRAVVLRRRAVVRRDRHRRRRLATAWLENRPWLP
jgi:hypothetical protein